MRRVVVTGMGAITPIGNDVPSFWAGVRRGECGVAPITHYDTAAQAVKLAAEVKGFVPEEHLDKREARKMDRFTQFAMTAAKEAMADAGFDREQVDPTRCGVLVSSGIGGIGTIASETLRGAEKGYDRVSPFFIPMSITNMAAGQIAIAFGLQGMCSCVVTACAGGTNTIGDAFHHIRDGYSDLMLCGGAEASITQLGIGGFTAMKALCRAEDPARASIPFDRERSGFVMGEGAGMLVLEEYEHAKARGAKIYCEVIGYGAACDAYHMTAPREDGSMAAKSMEIALQDAKLNPEQIDYINAHGTSTSLNDKGETLAVKRAFGAHAQKLCMSSTKSMTGHLLGASGAVEAIVLAKSVQEDFVPATIHYQQPDPDCDLDIVPNVGREQPVHCALSNSLGFGGHNASLIVRKWEG